MSGDMLSCWCWHSDKRSWSEPLLVPWNYFFLALPVERTAGSKCRGFQHSWLVGWVNSDACFYCCFIDVSFMYATSSFALCVWSHIVMFHSQMLRLILDLWTKLRQKIQTEFYIHTHHMSFLSTSRKLSATISPFHPSKQYFGEKNIPVLMSVMAQAFLSHMMLWRQLWFFWMNFISEGSLFQSICLDLRAVWRQM